MSEAAANSALDAAPAAAAERTTRRGRHGIDKRTQLLNAASKLFLKHGYEGSSINALARSSGISKESIYRYFDSKQALFEAVIDKELEAHGKALSALSVMQEGDAASLAQLQIAAEDILTVMTSDRTLALRRLMFQAATKSPEIGAHYHRIGPAGAYQQFEAFFERLRTPPEYSPGVLSRTFIALLLHEVMLGRACRVIPPLRKEEIEQRAKETVEMFALRFLQ